MRVFVTGATGFIGSFLVPELTEAGHQVLGLTRSDKGAAALKAQGAEVFRGDLEDPNSLREGAASADAVVHLAFDHNFSNFVANCEKDKRTIAALGEGLASSKGLMLVTSGTGMGSKAPGQLAVEDYFDKENHNPRKASEEAAEALQAKGLKVSVVRLPQVHDTRKQGLVTPYIQIAREKGTLAYVGDGANRWPAAHVTDVARLYRLAIEKGEGGRRYHAVAEEGVPVRSLAETIASGLKIPVKSIAPEEAPNFYGWLAPFAAMDLPASSEQTRQQLRWEPVGPDILTDLANMNYTQGA